jgi:type II secretory pathway predicted ATPase ExeA
VNRANAAGLSGVARNPATEITRTFSLFRESESQDTDFEFWFEQASGGGLTWDALLKKRLVVVLGEAGIGKTYEFRQQAQRLQSEEKAAFFVPLNSLERQEVRSR